MLLGFSHQKIATKNFDAKNVTAIQQNERETLQWRLLKMLVNHSFSGRPILMNLQSRD